MNKLILGLLLALPFTVVAQTTTNIAIRIQVETVTGGVTNTVSTNFRYDDGNKKDQQRVQGWALAFAQARAGGYTNDFGAWLKQDVGDRAMDYAKVKQAADNAVTLMKLTALLTANSDLLTAGDLANLATIAAKAP